jgi:tetratricopeptide (TPR) repeat protein
MAVVYLARDQRNRRDVAIKVFRTEGAPFDGAPRFHHEIEIAARLAHPNILPLHESGESEGLLYYVMPFVPGENLRQRLDREGALPVADALTVASQVASALAYAHSHGVIHRDIKPENILFIAGQAVVADFGIARAISAGGFDESQLGRGILGTPAYMSPEQSLNASRVDGRSDLYSLGCVLYEMLTGEPPFRGTTPEELAVQHIEAQPQPVHARRPTLSRELELLVGKALAKHPADRYQTAQQFAEAVETLNRGRAWSGAEPVVPVPNELPFVAWLRRLALPSVAAGSVAYALYVQVPTDPGWSWRSGDPALHMVAPFAHRDGAAPDLLSGDQCGRLVRDALGRWGDVELVDSRWTSDQVERLGHAASIDDYFAMARKAHAGRLISGEVYQFRDSIRVRGALYDVRRRREALREFTVTLAGDLADADRRFTELADSLLLPRSETPAAAGGAMGTHLLAAWRDYDAGHAALARWDLPGAATHFGEALTLDPSYGLAHLWLAQTESWSGEPSELWRDHVLASLGAQPGLPAADHAWALALAALADRRFPEACSRYAAMIQRDSLDFRGWYGRGECQAQDQAVMRDARSPSGWRYRSSYLGAIADFGRALTLVPSTHLAFKGAAFERLSRLFYAAPNTLRLGFPLPPDSGTYAAYPALDHDTLAFTPYPLSEVVQGVGPSFPASTTEAIKRNRETLARVTAQWVAAYPASPAALLARGMALEMSGTLESATPGAASALASYRKARRLSIDTATTVSAGAAEVRVLVKLDRLRPAQALADSLLTLNTEPDPAAAGTLASLAALIGRPSLARELMRQAAPTVTLRTSTGDSILIPLRTRQAALEFLAMAALGGPRDSLAAMEARLTREIGSLVAREEQAGVSDAVFGVARAISFAPGVSRASPASPAGGNRLLQMQDAWQRGDTATVRRWLTERDRLTRSVLLSDVALNGIIGRAQLYLALGDTVAARALLGQSIEGLSGAGLALIGDVPQASVPQAAAVPRIMAIGADLAARAGDATEARRLASKVLDLWQDAGGPLRATTDRMRALASTRAPR